MRRRTVGVVGGVGPLAGAVFYRELVEATPAHGDDEHLPVVIVSEPRIPSRSECLLRAGPSPGPVLREVVTRLARAGADLVVVPSSTCHAFYHEFANVGGVRCLNLVQEVGAWIGEKGWKRVGVLGTTAARVGQVYERMSGRDDVRFIYPRDELQGVVQAAVDAVKAGDRSADAAARLGPVLLGDWLREADGLVLACTELSVLGTGLRCLREMVSATRILAGAAVREALTPSAASETAP